jgi:hypothetical protein
MYIIVLFSDPAVCVICRPINIYAPKPKIIASTFPITPEPDPDLYESITKYTMKPTHNIIKGIAILLPPLPPDGDGKFAEIVDDI